MNCANPSGGKMAIITAVYLTQVTMQIPDAVVDQGFSAIQAWLEQQRANGPMGGEQARSQALGHDTMLLGYRFEQAAPVRRSGRVTRARAPRVRPYRPHYQLEPMA